MKLTKKTISNTKQKGFILVIALILMVIIALGAIASIRLSGASELMSSNVRARVLASEAANSVLNYCRYQVFANRKSVNILATGDRADEGIQWRDLDKWSDSNIISLTGFSGKAPMCMIEDIREYVHANDADTTRPVVAYRITARGFSPNYEADEGIQTKGAQVWLQLVVGRSIK